MSTHGPHISTSYLDHLLIGLGLGLWLYLFLAIIGPFDGATLSITIRMFLMGGYDLIFCVVYVLCIPVQNWWYARTKKWTWGAEAAFILLFCGTCLPACYRYYITDWVNGDWGFQRFAIEIFLSTLILIVPILIFARWLVARRASQTSAIPRESHTTLQLSGDNKLDVLQLSADQLIALSAANNYVTVYYLEDQQLQKRLLRTTLKKLQNDVPGLVQIHRSHLVNPDHFRAWKDGNTLSLGSLEFPVSKTYKSQLQAQGVFVPK